jgi:hypothetical protein
MKIGTILLFLSIIFSSVSAQSPKELALKLSLNPATKAIMQWERVFKSKRKMKRYKIDKLNDKDKQVLKEYLISHAADSDKPQFAGDI